MFGAFFNAVRGWSVGKPVCQAFSFKRHDPKVRKSMTPRFFGEKNIGLMCRCLLSLCSSRTGEKLDKSGVRSFNLEMLGIISAEFLLQTTWVDSLCAPELRLITVQ